MIGVAAVALVLRWVVLVQATGRPQLEVPVLDSRFYVVEGARWAAGTEDATRPFFLSPGYTAWVGAWLGAGHGQEARDSSRWVLSESARTKMLRVWKAQIGLDVLTCVLVALAAYPLAGRAALLAGLLLALHSTSALFAIRLLPATLGSFLVAVVLWLLVRPWAARRRWWLAVGVALGLLAVVRANALLCVPLLLGGLAFPARGRGRREIALQCAAFLTGVGLVILPVTVRNVLRSSEAVLLTSSGGVNFYIGNSRASDGRFISLNQLPLAPGQFADDPTDGAFERSTAAYAERSLSRPLSASEVSNFWMRQARSEIAADPAGWVRLLASKVLLLLSGFEIPQIDNLYFLADTQLPALRGPWLYSSRWLWPLGALGVLVLLAYERKAALLPLLFLAGFAASIVLFFVTARYRLPLVPILCWAAAIGLSRLFGMLRTRPLRAAGWGAALAGIGLLAQLNPGLLARPVDAAAAGERGWFAVDSQFLDYKVQHNNMAARCLERGDVAEAEKEVRAGLVLQPMHPTLLFNLGRILHAKGDLEGALEALQASLRTGPMNTSAARLAAEVSYYLGRYELAAEIATTTLAWSSDDAELWNTLGGARSKLGLHAQALEAFRRALELQPDSVSTRYNTGRVLTKLGQGTEAVATLEPLYRWQAGNPSFAYSFAEALIEAGEPGRAEQVLEGLLDTVPDHIAALLLRGELALRVGERDMARTHALRVLQLRPGHERALALLAACGADQS